MICQYEFLRIIKISFLTHTFSLRPMIVQMQSIPINLSKKIINFSLEDHLLTQKIRLILQKIYQLKDINRSTLYTRGKLKKILKKKVLRYRLDFFSLNYIYQLYQSQRYNNFILNETQTFIMTKISYRKNNDDEEYRPTHNSKTNPRRKKPQSVQNNIKNSNKWTLQQNQRFLEFVRVNKKILACQKKRKELRVFLQLSRYVGTRTSDQCRSHHQKMIKHHNDLDGIIQNLEKRITDSLQPLVKIEEEEHELYQVKEEQDKQKKQEENSFFNTKIDIYMESEHNSEKNLWEVLNQEFWSEKPIDILFNF